VEEVALDVGVGGGEVAKVSQMLIRNGSEYQIVLYWYQNRGRIIASEYWEKVYLVIDAIAKGRRDGAFVRIMTEAEGSEIEAAKSRSRKFAEHAMMILTEYLPGSDL
jgi:EpsI family protein